MSKLSRGILAACCALGLASGAAAQASVNLSTLDPAYRDLEKLVAARLVDPTIVGQRPYSRIDFARFARQARSRLTPAHSAHIQSTVTRLEERFAEELAILAQPLLAEQVAFRPLDELSAEVLAAKNPERLVPEQPFGRIDAAISPLFGYREGRRPIDGTTAALETVHRLRLARQLVVYLQPRFQITEGRGNTPELNEVSIQEAYGALLFGNLSIQLGRANMVWGQGRHAGLTISPNARGFDMVSVSNQQPRVPPWIFRFLGPTKGTLFFATLVADRERHFLNSYVLGYKVSFLPASWLELGGSLMLESGGEGAPGAGFFDRLADHTFFVSILRPESEQQFSNKIAGIEFRATIPGAAGLQLYGEGALDDLSPIRNPGKSITQDSGWLIGVYAPRLDRAGRLDLSFEYQFSGLTLYRHGQFQTGLAVDRHFFGNILGPEGRAGYAEVHWDATTDNTFGLETAYEGRSKDLYTPDRRAKLERRPQERRYRGVASWTYRPLARPYQLTTLAGYERVNSFDFQAGESRDNFIGQVRLEWRF